MKEIKTTPCSKVNKNNTKYNKTKEMLYYAPIRGKIKKCPKRMEHNAVLSIEKDKSEQINDISLKEGGDKYVLIIHEKDIKIKNNLVKKKQYAYYPPKKESLTFKRMNISENIKKYIYPKNDEKKNALYFKQKIEKEQNNCIPSFDKKKKRKEKKIKEKNNQDNNDSTLKSLNYRNDLFDNILRKIKIKKNKLKEKAINENYILKENRNILKNNKSHEIQTEAICLNDNTSYAICRCDLVNICNEHISYYEENQNMNNRWLLERRYSNEIHRSSKKNRELSINSKDYKESKQAQCETCENCKNNALNNSKKKEDMMYINIDNNFFNSNKSNELEGAPYVKFDRYSNNGKNISASILNKFFFIFCNGCLVVFLGVSNNICGRMRNRILKNFDSLTASYNAITYVIIYSFLCIVCIKSKNIRKEHWLYIYPCLKKYFFKEIAPNKKKQNESIELLKNEEIGHERNYLVEIKSNEKIKRAKKIMNFFHNNKKNILNNDFSMENINNYNSESSNHNLSQKHQNVFLRFVPKNKYNQMYEYSINDNNSSSIDEENKSICKKKSYLLNESSVYSKYHNSPYENCTKNGNVTNKSAICERCHTCNSVIKKDEMENEMKEEAYKIYKDNKYRHGNKKYKLYNETKQCTFSKDEMKHLLKNEEHRKNKKYIYGFDNIKYLKKYKDNNCYNIFKHQWTNMGAYKYVVIVSILDIISNTLYFVSQLAIPLTILLLLNQLNFIFSIILSYLILKRKYNRHHAISVIIVLTGFLFFYVPYIYNDNTNFIKKNILANYYINSNSFINLSQFNIFSFRNLETINAPSEPLNMSPFGLISSIMLCVVSIILTSYGGILREIFFCEYVKQRKNHITLMDNQTCLDKSYLYVHGIEELYHNRQINEFNFPVLYKKDEKNKKCNYCNRNKYYISPKNSRDEIIECAIPSHNIINEKENNKYEYITKNIKEPRSLKKMSVILLSFNIALIQILLLPIISYFQFLFNPSNNISYLLYIKDSLRCFSGNTTENNENCKFSLLIYCVYIIVNVLFNLSVSYFYSNYSSAECFLILKSSTPLTLVVLYFYDFPFISDSDKYFSIYFIISIFIVFTGVSYFFYQNITPEKETIKPERKE
ncbi:conserved Plasmodium protein, unknown function [Plasmodium berghei]|uniref:Transporter n=1 Tax=Plasmodium berghei TaxID=5821 RepID=A0A1D3S9M0_PLABE|nr:conserved Plasmodium protein, unknown function [Plasmodium berghei]